MRVKNPAAAARTGSSAAERDALSVYLSGKSEASFSDVRKAVPELAEATDGRLAQVARDAGFEVEA